MLKSSEKQPSITPTPSTPSPEPSETTPAPTPSTPSPEPSETTPAPTPQPTTTQVPPPASGAIIIDHTSVDLFDQIPANYLEAAKNLGLLFSNRSVGDNINASLDCLAAPSWSESSNSCRKAYYDDQWHYRLFFQEDLDQGIVPQEIMFDPDPQTYNRDNWSYEHREDTWSGLTQDFIQSLAPAYIPSKDALSYQFSYLNVTDNDNIADPDTGFFSDTPNAYDIHDLEAFIAQHPDKTFIFWTSSLARSIGTYNAQYFNEQMRQYVLEHDKILFDVADIEAHTASGAQCFDNRDGILYCDQNTGECENYPDDGINLSAICQDYTTEVDAGHLGSVSEGRIRIAKAFWVLMARVAGWDGISP